MKARFTLIAAGFALAILVSVPSPSFAQGTAFTYQGRLNADGIPGNGLFDITFSLQSSDSGPAQIAAAQTNNSVVVSNGLFHVLLDFGSSVFDGTARWLEISVRTNGGAGYVTLGPRQPITPTPYAITASNLSGRLASSQLSGTISPNNIAAGSITGLMLANGSVGSNQLAAGAVTTPALADGIITASKLSTSSYWLPLTITNPTPAVFDYFGYPVMAWESNRVAVAAFGDDTGAPDAGAVYVFNTNGALLTTYTNPAPTASAYFGRSVVALSSSRLLIGAPGDSRSGPSAGAAYVFGAFGSPLIFTNPAPANGGNFGQAAATLGANRVLIGGSGAAYLFNSFSRVLLATFTNPAPAIADEFGFSVASVGDDYVLIGAFRDGPATTNGGAAFLFNTNGALVTTFTNPSPEFGDWFGISLAALGNDRVLISAPDHDAGAIDSGLVYLFSTNGTLLTTLTNPAPGTGDFFGRSVAVADANRILIGTPYDDTAAIDSGAAYLFDTNGTLLATFTDPTATVSGLFGYSLTALSSDRFVIGAFQENIGAGNAGAAFLFTMSSFMPGLQAESVRAGSITSSSIATGAVTTVQLGPGAVNASQLAPSAVTTSAIADSAITGAKIATALNGSPLVLTNPHPAPNNWFGGALAGLGSDRVIVGVPLDDASGIDAGIAYLFATNGTVLSTFTNPSPAPGDNFGNSVAALGMDRVLIGSYYGGVGKGGVAYLFTTNGALVSTFLNPNPSPNDLFGYPVAALGNDRVLIGAYQDDAGAQDAGVVYLFRTNGTLLTTFTNPVPRALAYFGLSLAAVGTDRVLVGAPYSFDSTNVPSAYLFDTNGALLRTFTNPAPVVGTLFGYSVAAVGSDSVLIGAFGDDSAALDSGAAFLFSANGTLRKTFRKPNAIGGERFGLAVAALGSDRVVIGAQLDSISGVNQAGAAYVFGTNGSLLTTFTSPAANVNGFFGNPVAAIGNDQIAVAALFEFANATNAGVVYLLGTERFTPGLVAEAVKSGSITSSSLAEGAVTEAKLDPSIGVWTRSGSNVYRFEGNVGIGTSQFTNNRLEVAGTVGALAFNSTSDRAAKQDFTAVNTEDVLAKVATLPIAEWSFKGFPGTRHLGPTAQDFYGAFGFGSDDKHITTVDADGVALAAIQALNRKLQEKDSEVRELRRRLEHLERLISTNTHPDERRAPAQ